MALFEKYPEIPWFGRQYSQAVKPEITWPNGARLAVVIHTSFEAWSELMHPAVVAYRSGQSEFKGPPEGVTVDYDYFSATGHDYGGRVGIYRALDLYDKYGITGTFSISGLAAERYPEAVKEAADRGHDIAAHGWAQDIRHTMLTRQDQQLEIRRCADILEAVTGSRPTGWISPGGGGGRDLLELLVEEGFTWLGDPKNDDNPYFLDVNGERLVIVASKGGSTSVNDVELYRGGQPRALLAKFVDEFDQLYEESLTSPKMLIAASHTELQVPNNTRVWGEMIAYAQGFPKVWLTTRGAIAGHMLASEQSIS